MGWPRGSLRHSPRTYEEFRGDYEIYIQLLRDLAVQGEIPVTVDSNSLEGIKTHHYCTNNQPNNYSDHVDPYPYLAKWGISKEQFKKDVETGVISTLPTKVESDVLDTNTNLENREQPYYRGYLSEDYYVELSPGHIHDYIRYMRTPYSKIELSPDLEFERIITDPELFRQTLKEAKEYASNQQLP